MEDRKLEQALSVYFGGKSANPAETEAAGKYLKMRIRSVMEVLIEEEDTGKMEKLEEMGWFGERELEVFIKSAREKEKTVPLMWLLHLKNRKYGYKDRDFSL